MKIAPMTARSRSGRSAPGVTRTPDPRIRNPLLYPAELRAQNQPRHIPRFATNKRKHAAPFVVLLEASTRATTQRHQYFSGSYADKQLQRVSKNRRPADSPIAPSNSAGQLTEKLWN